jgi:hypothetical protein
MSLPRIARNPVEFVDLACVREGSKLRVRITSPGYLHEANCQFPRAIRAAGRRYRVPARDVKLAAGVRNFYRVNGRSVQIIEANVAAAVPEPAPAPIAVVPAKIYEDTDEKNCIICAEREKDTVLAECGHFYTCAPCAEKLTACPICRGAIAARLHKSQIE